ncbi:hypothetical protein [Nonomuraea salmonea]|uniref:Uncharacterized protein n=1 Tax=Nonomuraea salmonea TaxID=46181 RepID=A0ABV5P2T9_9ACTN
MRIRMDRALETIGGQRWPEPVPGVDAALDAGRDLHEWLLSVYVATGGQASVRVPNIGEFA